MVQIPGSVPPPVFSSQPKKTENVSDKKPAVAAQKTSITGDPFALDSRAIAVRMAALAADARLKELSFEEVIEKVIKETGIAEAQAALEEANRRLQKEIEDEIVKIKDNKDLMEEAESWQELAELLENKMTPEQVTEFVGMLESEIKGIK